MKNKCINCKYHIINDQIIDCDNVDALIEDGSFFMASNCSFFEECDNDD